MVRDLFSSFIIVITNTIISVDRILEVVETVDRTLLLLCNLLLFIFAIFDTAPI